MQVLIADSDSGFLEVAGRYISRSGHEVQTASNGIECFTRLRDGTPDIVVLDGELLWGGSTGVLALMQQDPAWSEIPVILTSDFGLPQRLGLNSAPRLVAQLPKPFRLIDLLGHLQACAAAQRAESQRVVAKNSDT
jgi:CheY-like chemotaxis protein